MELPALNKTDDKSGLKKYDKLVFMIIMAHLPVIIFFVPIGYDTFAFALTAGLIIGVLACLGYFVTSGTPAFGIIAGVLLMSISAVMIQAQFGRLEMHFHIFCALAILLIYRNWVNILVPASTIAVHHLLLTYLQLEGVVFAGVPVQAFAYDCSWGLTLVHAAFVVFESAVLIYFTVIMHREERVSAELVETVRAVQRDYDLSLRISTTSEGNITDEFNGLLENFETLTTDISQASEAIEKTAHDIDQSSNDSQRVINLQNEKTMAVVDSMDNMSVSTQELSSHIGEVAETIDKANGQANVASAEVTTVVNLAQKLESSMVQTSDAISKLAKSAESIGGVVDVIRGISEQTNLLALNAAIEAARAGESGRGFAVVADEVRTLAQRTQSSTEEIQAIIESLQSATQNAVSHIDQGQKITQQSLQGITGTNAALGIVFDAVKGIHEMNGQLSNLAKQQERTILSVSENMRSISELSSQTTTKVANSLENVSTLNQVSQTLAHRVEMYKRLP